MTEQAISVSAFAGAQRLEPDAETSCVALATSRLGRIELSTMLTELNHPYTEDTQVVDRRYVKRG